MLHLIFIKYVACRLIIIFTDTYAAAMKNVVYVILSTLFLSVGVEAVSQPICGFDGLHRSMQQVSPALKRKLELNEQKISSAIQARRAGRLPLHRRNALVYIPVVVHVLHTGGPVGSRYNPPDAQIEAAIAYLNEIYSGTHPSLTPAGVNAAGDLGIRFALAQRDPDCNPTSGIHRINMSANSDYINNGVSSNDYAADVAFKTPIIWDKTRYYNIYVVNKINGQDGSAGQFIAGYAYFPTDAVVDGTVMLASQMKADSKTLSHEIGHAFNLYHPFEGSANKSQCPAGLGDRVDDTDPISYNASTTGVVDFTCRTSLNKCNANAPFNIRTESNFMNYTNCYTLFTPGQKERMQASLELAERSSLMESTALLRPDESPACTPKINFEFAQQHVRAAREVTEGCRGYKDYLFYLTIGSTPSQNANVIVSADPSSTAREGVDFDFPSGKEVEFLSTGFEKQGFVVRVYDNGSAQPFKKATLNFTVDNNNGNAVKGTANPQMDLVIQTINHSPVEPGAGGVALVGVFNYLINDAKTFDASIRRQKTQIIYRASELSASGIQAGYIKEISFYIQKQSTRAFKNLNIKMAQTGIAALVQDGNVTTATDFTDVLTLPGYETVDGWNNFLLQTPFAWNGTDNVAVELCFDNITGEPDNADIIRAYNDGSAETEANMIVGEDLDCTASYSNIAYYQGGIKPIVKFNYELLGNPVRNTLVTSRNEYLGPYSEIYFYDNSSPRKIVGKIKNLTNWNYGCTNIKVDRSGSNATAFWNTTASQYLTRKSFFVTPQFNNPEGKFEITLYYSASEKNGYETATGNSWNNIKLVKTKVPVSQITPANPQQEKVEINPTVEHTEYGVDYMLTAAFNSGFSGFSAGIINTTLPVTWLNFTALLQNDDVQLNWTTATESNNNRFEVEVSTNGVDFAWLATIPSSGNSAVTTGYGYLHKQPLPRELFYRLRQVDNDGVFSYSSIVRIIRQQPGNGAYLYPVPAANYITLHLGQPALNAVIEIFSGDMKLLSSERTRGMLLTRQLSLHALPAGTYFVRVITAKRNEVMRFVKY